MQNINTRDSWNRIKVICNNANNKPDCIGCGMNNTHDGFVWQLSSRIPCANAEIGYVSYEESKA